MGFNNMFNGATAFNQNLNAWSFADPDPMRVNMFTGANNFKQNILNWPSWGVTASSVATLCGAGPTCTFSEFSRKSDLEAELKKACAKEDASTYFSNDYGPITDFMFDTKVTDMSGLFKGQEKCDPNISQWNVENVVNFSSMFEKAGKFNQDLSGWNPVKGENFDNMFKKAKSFRQWLNKEGDWPNMAFRSTGFCSDGAICTYKPFGNDPDDPDSLGNQVRAYCDKQADPKSETLLDEGNRYYNPTVIELNDSFGPIADWNVERIVDFSSLFESQKTCTADLKKWNVLSGTDFRNMFAETQKFNSDLSAWNVAGGTHFNEMFEAATAFNSAIDDWGEKLKEPTATYDFMFFGATSFKQDLSSWPKKAKDSPGFCSGGAFCDGDLFPSSAPSKSPVAAPTPSAAFSVSKDASIFTLVAVLVTFFIR